MKPGPITCGIISAWTWAVTLLQSSTVAYEYGNMLESRNVRCYSLTSLIVAGPFWVSISEVETGTFD